MISPPLTPGPSDLSRLPSLNPTSSPHSQAIVSFPNCSSAVPDVLKELIFFSNAYCLSLVNIIGVDLFRHFSYVLNDQTIADIDQSLLYLLSRLISFLLHHSYSTVLFYVLSILLEGIWEEGLSPAPVCKKKQYYTSAWLL